MSKAWSGQQKPLCFPCNRRKAGLTRPEMAAALLAEVAYENSADWGPHLPQALHALALLLDSPEPLVHQHAHQVG